MRYAEYAISTGKGVKGHSRTLAHGNVFGLDALSISNAPVDRVPLFGGQQHLFPPHGS